MPLQRGAPKFEQTFGAVRITLDELVEVESMLPDESFRSITAGDYTADHVTELAATTDKTLPNVFMGGPLVQVFIYPRWTKVKSISDHQEHRVAAEHIYNFLKKRRVKWMGVDPVAFSVMTVLWLAVHIALSFLAVHLVGRMEWQDPWSIAAVVLVVMGWVAVYVTYIWSVRRIRGPGPGDRASRRTTVDRPARDAGGHHGFRGYRPHRTGPDGLLQPQVAVTGFGASASC